MFIRAALRLHTFTILRPFADFFLGDDPGNAGVYLCNHPMRSRAGNVFYEIIWDDKIILMIRVMFRR